MLPRNVKHAVAAALLAGALILARAVPARAASLQVFPSGALHLFPLDNGLRVVVKEDHSAPVVALDLVIRAGVRRETRQNNGVSHFLEHMIFRAARSGQDDFLGGPIEALGGVVNAGTLRDFTHFYAVTASEHFGLALAALARAVLHPPFDNSAVFSERLVLMREVRQLADDPRAALWDLAFQVAYPDHPYALPIGGTEASLAAVHAQILADFHRRWYVASNASLVIVGDVAPQVARDAAARAFGAWERGLPSEPVAAVSTPGQARERVETRDLARAMVLLAFQAPAVTTPREVCAADLLLAVLAQGYRSRLARALRDPGLADDVSADFLTQQLPGLFGIEATCAPDRVADLRRALEAEISRLRSDLIGDEELAKAKRRLAHDYVFANETFEDQAQTLGFYEAIADYEFAVTYLERVESLTSADLRAVARRYLDPQRAVWVALVPPAASASPADDKAIP